MAAPKGNEFYKFAINPGRPPCFKSPQQLMSACQEYVQWILDNPLKEIKLFNGKDEVRKVSVDKMRIMTIKSLCLFLGINSDTWYDYASKRGKEFSDTCARVSNMIYCQKLEGAAAGLCDAGIIGKEIGLDKPDTTLGDALGQLLAAIDGNSRNNPGAELEQAGPDSKLLNEPEKQG